VLKVKRKNTFILFFSLMVVMTGYGIAMPVLPFYVESLGGRGVHYGLLIASYGVMQLIFAPVWGSLSDKYGRKPILLVGLIGLGMAMSLFALANKLWMLYAAQMLLAVCLLLHCRQHKPMLVTALPRKKEEEQWVKLGGQLVWV
jgi:DHA1 family multidrug resistance protein-like MFS transporter